MRKGATGTEFTLNSWKTEIAKCTLCKRRTGEAKPRAAKFARLNNSRAQSLYWELWVGNHHRHALVGQILASQRSVMKQNFFRSTWHHFLEFGINLWSWPWNLRPHLTLQKDLGLLNGGMLKRGEVLCITVAVDQSTVKIGGNDVKPTVQN